MKKKNLLGTVFAALLLCTVFTACSSRGGESSSVSSSLSSAASDREESTSPSPDASASSDGSGSSDSSASGSSGASEGGVSGLSAFRDTLRDVYGDKYYPDTEMTEDEIRDELGLTDDLYEEVYAERTAQKAHPDTFIAVKVKDGKTEAVKEKLEAYKSQLKEDEDFSANADKLDAAQIYDNGDYVFFVLLGDVDDNVSSEGVAEAFGNEIQKGIDAIQKALDLDR